MSAPKSRRRFVPGFVPTLAVVAVTLAAAVGPLSAG
jgi:hypothetical protein